MHSIGLSLVFLILALVFELLAAINVPSNGRISWGWLGLFFYFLMILVNRTAGV